MIYLLVGLLTVTAFLSASYALGRFLLQFQWFQDSWSDSDGYGPKLGLGALVLFVSSIAFFLTVLIGVLVMLPFRGSM